MAVDKAVSLDRLGAEIDRFATLLASTDLTAPVKSCPGWTVEDLASHLGAVHRWARANIGSSTQADFPEHPSGDLVTWFTDGGAALLARLSEAEVDEPSWTFAPPRTAGFWLRRQVQETFVHRIDLEDAAGSPGPRDPDVATDGIDEALTLFTPRIARRGQGPTMTAPVTLRCNDTGGYWTLSPDLTVSQDVSNAVLEAPAEVLLLLLWRRVDPADQRVVRSGDAGAIDALLAGRLTP